MQYAAIYEEDQLLAEQKFDTAKGLIRLPNLFFTEKTEKHYTITARDSE
ncbi:MAG: hypothetical protein Q4B28_03905 [bacterium]|nr:hypothetical protein [bacterium]